MRQKMKARSIFLKLIIFISLIPVFSLEISPAVELGNEIEADHPNIQYVGRIYFEESKAPILYWPGTSIVAKFEGGSIKLKLNDLSGQNFYNIIIDDNDAHPFVLDCQKGDAVYPIASDLGDTVHKIEIFRRRETATGPTLFKGFILDSGKNLVEPPARYKRRIELYGNSITSGMGNECSENDDQNDESKKNNYLAYGAITARNLKAEYICISKSGIGLLISWFPLTMPEFYDREDPSDPNSKWDFSKWIPDVVVVNLFQNDSWLLHNLHPIPSSEQIIEAYINFIRKLREKYSEAYIFCTLGNMDATRPDKPWSGYIKSAVQKMRLDYKDDKICSYIFPFKGTDSHPTVKEHRKMADHLTRYIKKVLNW
jgi:hypothetical protein